MKYIIQLCTKCIVTYITNTALDYKGTYKSCLALQDSMSNLKAYKYCENRPHMAVLSSPQPV